MRESSPIPDKTTIERMMEHMVQSRQKFENVVDALGSTNNDLKQGK